MAKKLQLPQETINLAIRLAWEDRTSFEEIKKRLDLTESQIIKLMRQELKPSSFRLWRKRVSGRITKHQKRFRNGRNALRRAQRMNDIS